MPTPLLSVTCLKKNDTVKTLLACNTNVAKVVNGVVKLIIKQMNKCIKERSDTS